MLELECVLKLRLVVGGVKVLGALVVDEVVTFGVLVAGVLVTAGVLVAAGGLLTALVLVTVDVVTVLCADTVRLSVLCLTLCRGFGLAASFADVVLVTFAGTVTVPTCDAGACVL